MCGLWQSETAKELCRVERQMTRKLGEDMKEERELRLLTSYIVYLSFKSSPKQKYSTTQIGRLLVLQRVIKVRSAFNVIRLLDYHEKEKHQQS